MSTVKPVLRSSRHIREGKDTLLMNVLLVIVIGGFCILCLAPFVMMIASSFESEYRLAHDGYTFWPREFTLNAYDMILKSGQIASAYRVTIFITVVGTVLSMLMTIMMAYPLSLDHLRGKTFITFLV